MKANRLLQQGVQQDVQSCEGGSEAMGASKPRASPRRFSRLNSEFSTHKRRERDQTNEAILAEIRALASERRAAIEQREQLAEAERAETASRRAARRALGTAQRVRSGVTEFLLRVRDGLRSDHTFINLVAPPDEDSPISEAQVVQIFWNTLYAELFLISLQNNASAEGATSGGGGRRGGAAQLTTSTSNSYALSVSTFTIAPVTALTQGVIASGLTMGFVALFAYVFTLGNSHQRKQRRAKDVLSLAAIKSSARQLWARCCVMRTPEEHYKVKNSDQRQDEDEREAGGRADGSSKLPEPPDDMMYIKERSLSLHARICFLVGCVVCPGLNFLALRFGWRTTHRLVPIDEQQEQQEKHEKEEQEEQEGKGTPSKAASIHSWTTECGEGATPSSQPSASEVFYEDEITDRSGHVPELQNKSQEETDLGVADAKGKSAVSDVHMSAAESQDQIRKRALRAERVRQRDLERSLRLREAKEYTFSLQLPARRTAKMLVQRQPTTQTMSFAATAVSLQLRSMREQLHWRNEREFCLRLCAAWVFNLIIPALCCVFAIVYSAQIGDVQVCAKERSCPPPSS